MRIEDLDNKQFELFGSKYTIKFVDTLDEPDSDISHYGLTTNPKYLIEIAKNVKGNLQSEDELYLTLVHEIVHVILDVGNYCNTSGDEPLVEWTARCIISLLKQNILCK